METDSYLHRQPDLVPRSMGTMVKIEIVLEKDIDEHYHYKPGEYVSGTVKLFVQNGDVDITSLRINICGVCNVGWQAEGQTLKSQEEYVNDSMTLAPLDASAMTLNSGTHDFLFNYQLPSRLPSSFIGKYGSITYVIKASAQSKRQHIICSEPFLVTNRLFPWSKQDMMKPIECSSEKRYHSGLLHRKGKVKVTLSLPRSGYYPGDDININVEVINSSPRIVTGIHASLMMSVSFTAQTNVHTHIQVLAKRTENWELARGEGRRWNNAYISIPMYTPESKLEGCDIIEIKFELLLKIEVKKKPGEDDLVLSLPVIIGPLSQITEQNSQKQSKKIPRTLDRKTLQDMDIAKLLEFQQDGEEFKYEEPVSDGTLRVNPLYNRNFSTSEDKEEGNSTPSSPRPTLGEDFFEEIGSQESLNQSTRL